MQHNNMKRFIFLVFLSVKNAYIKKAASFTKVCYKKYNIILNSRNLFVLFFSEVGNTIVCDGRHHQTTVIGLLLLT